MNQKTKKDCNGVEDEIYNLIKANKIDWFPLGKSYSLSSSLFDFFFIMLQPISF